MGFQTTSDARAVLSDDGVYRYWLRRELEPQFGTEVGHTCLFIMLNPSTADADVDDPTIRRCKGFAQSIGCDGLEVVNLFAYRATDPTELIAAHRSGVDIIGPDNADHIARAVSGAHDVIAAWGNHAPLERVTQLLNMTGMGGMYCLGTTIHGSPRHPLYVRADAQITPWMPNA